MSGIAHFQPPSNTEPSNVQHFTQTPVHIAVPVWTDTPAPNIPIPSSPAQPYYVTNPPSVPPQPQPRELETSPAPPPRPRKPYTTTKVREMWTTAEHERMLQGLRLYKRDWAKVTSYVGTRSAAQVRSHAQKYFDRVAREKTDEYVPRARPKRKSSTPYPRKLREQASNAQPSQHHYSAPVTPTYPLPVVHPSTTPYEMQQVALASPPQLHYPVRIAPGRSPILPHIPSTPYIPQPQHHTVGAQVPVSNTPYPPFVEMSPTPNSNIPRAEVHASPEIQASPLSYVSSQSYPGHAAHSPSIPQHAISIPATQIYGVLSPVTPGAFAFGSSRSPSMAHTPVTLYGQPGSIGTSVPDVMLRHSHGGPVDNCAKCSALQRYGAVLQEIGELSYAHVQPDRPAHYKKTAHASSPALNKTAPVINSTVAAVSRREDRNEHTTGDMDNRQASSTSGSSSPRKKRLDSSSPSCSEEGNDLCTQTAPAGNRAHRLKIIRARKLKQHTYTPKERSGNSQSPYEEQSESSNSTMENQHCARPGKEGLARPQRPSLRAAEAVSKKRELSRTDHNTDKTDPRKRQRSSSLAECQKGQFGRKDVQLEAKCHQRASDRQNGLQEEGRGPSRGSATNNGDSPSPKSDESETGPHSPTVETYSPKERMELFDAVHSLQILAKTSSSGSPSSQSKRGQPGSQED